ncbi:hypothetical protein BD809_10162 [Aquimarina intermedia]|uniref:Uncharacterized protein n=1 Tax=Aquimarina intermedia TaxID=350814 RepID=A0A5S5CF47_9FLAO|nr:hypothetical protein BD809_10162 [Aquimarina intermedia]
MLKISKVHKVILFFIFIFIVGVYIFMVHIGNSIDKNNKFHPEDYQTEIDSSHTTKLHNTSKPNS